METSGLLIRIHHAYGDDALLYEDLRHSILNTLSQLFLVTFISRKFPRLLAEREIIANAFLFTNDVWKWSLPNPLQRYK